MRASERKGLSKDLLCRRRRRFEHVKNPPLIDLKREQVQRVTLDPCTFTFSFPPCLFSFFLELLSSSSWVSV